MKSLALLLLLAVGGGVAPSLVGGGRPAPSPVRRDQAPRPADLLPDLRTGPIDTVYVETREGRRFLRLSNEILNRGRGPFELLTRAEQTRGGRSAYQRIYRDGDGDRRFRRGVDRRSRLRFAGSVVFHIRGTRVTAQRHAFTLSDFQTPAAGLERPSEIAFLPDGRALVAEQAGRVRLVTRAEQLVDRPLAELDVATSATPAAAGLLGIAVDPEFECNGFVYVYRTRGEDGAVVRYRFEGEGLRHEATILRGIVGGPAHNRGRLRFGPDGNLYVAIGDATLPHLAQDPASPNGKILRLAPDQFRGSGGRPHVVSLGHREPEGFDWQPGSGLLALVEQGSDRQDELNLIRQGGNYGWPEVRGLEGGPRFAPATRVLERMAPSAATFVPPGSAWAGDLLVTTRDGRLVRVGFAGTRIAEKETILRGELGPLSAIASARGRVLHLLTARGEIVTARLPAPPHQASVHGCRWRAHA